MTLGSVELSAFQRSNTASDCSWFTVSSRSVPVNGRLRVTRALRHRDGELLRIASGVDRG